MQRSMPQTFYKFELSRRFRRNTLVAMRRHSLSLLALFLIAFVTAPVTADAQQWAKTRLDASPRHREYVTLKHGDRSLQAFVVYPEVSKKVPVVILIHEIFGLSDWAKGMADELAAAGYIVVAPDLLSGRGPNGGNSDSFTSMDATTKAVSGLNADQVLADLDAAADYAKKIPSSNGTFVTAGFCWGGGKSFAFATHRPDLGAAFVFYGPPPSEFTTITAPVYGFYAGNDARIDATIPATTEAMKAAGKKYDPVTYDGAGHGFMRAGEDPANTNPANKAARDQAFERLTSLLKSLPAAHASVATPRSSNSIAKHGKSSAPAASCHNEAHAAAL
jgi:carboxymethylenebutenolidase